MYVYVYVYVYVCVYVYVYVYVCVYVYVYVIGGKSKKSLLEYSLSKNIIKRSTHGDFSATFRSTLLIIKLTKKKILNEKKKSKIKTSRGRRLGVGVN